MGAPFLEKDPDGFGPGERVKAISDAVEIYLSDIANGDEAEKPEPLVWLQWVERWGLPYPGGWIDQPCFFMLDINAAYSGRENYKAIQVINEKNRRKAQQQQAPRLLPREALAFPGR